MSENSFTDEQIEAVLVEINGIAPVSYSADQRHTAQLILEARAQKKERDQALADYKQLDERRQELVAYIQKIEADSFAVHSTRIQENERLRAAFEAPNLWELGTEDLLRYLRDYMEGNDAP